MSFRNKEFLENDRLIGANVVFCDFVLFGFKIKYFFIWKN